MGSLSEQDLNIYLLNLQQSENKAKQSLFCFLAIFIFSYWSMLFSFSIGTDRATCLLILGKDG